MFTLHNDMYIEFTINDEVLDDPKGRKMCCHLFGFLDEDDLHYYKRLRVSLEQFALFIVWRNQLGFKNVYEELDVMLYRRDREQSIYDATDKLTITTGLKVKKQGE